MLSLKIAVATRCFESPLKRSLVTARDIGAMGVQLDARRELVPTELSETGRRQFLHHLDELGLAVASLRFEARRALHDFERLEARLDALKATMQLAANLKCRVVAVRLGRVPAEDAAEERSLLLGILNDLARYGNHIGAALAITPSRETPEVLAQIIREVTEGPLGINFDGARFIAAGSDPSEAFRMLHASVLHVQVRDAVREADGTAVEVPVGRGEVEWDALLALIDESGFGGWLTVDRTEGNDKQNDAARAIQYLRQLGIS